MIEEIFSKDLPLLSKKIDHKKLEKLITLYKKKTFDEEQFSNENEKMAIFLIKYILELHSKINENKYNEKDLRNSYRTATTVFEKKEILLKFTTKLNPSKKNRLLDENALNEFLDLEAVCERYLNQKSKFIRELVFALERLGVIVKNYLISLDEPSSQQVWKKIDLSKQLIELLDPKEDLHIVKATFECIKNTISSLANIEKTSEDFIVVKFAYRFSMEKNRDCWLQISALELLSYLSKNDFLEAIEKRMNPTDIKDDIFIRHRGLIMLSQKYGNEEIYLKLAKKSLNDTSEFVRQGLCKSLQYTNNNFRKVISENIIDKEKDPSVLATLLDVMVDFFYNDQELVFKIIFKFLESENIFLVRFTIDTFVNSIIKAKTKNLLIDESNFSKLVKKIENINSAHQNLSLRRYAGEYLEQIEVFTNKNNFEIFVILENLMKNHPNKKILKFPKSLEKYESSDICRVFGVMALYNYPIELEKNFFGKYTIKIGIEQTPKFWRFLYEFLSPCPDKREAYSHTVGRVFTGDYIFPSNIMAEVTPTKVPGEPVKFDNENSWRPYLPLVDNYHSLLIKFPFSSGSVLIFSSEGITKIHSELNPLKKLFGWYKLTTNYSHYAHLRNTQSSDKSLLKKYIQEITKLGIQTSFVPYKKNVDPKIMEFFPAVGFLGFEEYFNSFSDYFTSVYDNSLNQLLVFVIFLLSIFLLNHIKKTSAIKKSRKKIPLVIGGWGSRGKSGTERIKAGLFNGLGYSVVSKTTGCEAMFLYSRSFEPLREMYLFRPYEKATIWEQANVVTMGEKLDCDVFLWECMGLTPSYVEILQRSWMEDDISTITNTYPDHENLQGPSALDIPKVMTKFIPKNSILFTTEEEMTPILENEAKLVNTYFKQISWKKIGMIAPDILTRFPYDEHPNNIALVLEMAEELGINYDVALKNMADYVVPDIGVLKTYPTSKIENKKLEFINGMSANERFGCLNNWNRLKMYQYDLESFPNIYLSTVINNRADRISRSRVFADIIAGDIVADTNFLIGTNLNGFLGYFNDALEEKIEQFSLFSSDNDPINNLIDILKRQRIPWTHEILYKRLQPIFESFNLKIDAQMLVAVDKYLEQITIFDIYTKESLQTIVSSYLFGQKILESIKKNNPKEIIQDEFNKGIFEILKKRFVVIADPHILGDEILHIIYSNTPSGMKNKIMGIQNIKGPGLELVYKFEEWDSCFKICNKLNSQKISEIEEGFKGLLSFRNHSILTYEHIKSSLSLLKQKPIAQNEFYQGEIDSILSLSQIKFKNFFENKKTIKNDKPKWLNEMINLLEEFLDAGDSVKRRKKADLIYDNLINMRISQSNAKKELNALTKRQKGGWLQKTLDLF